MYTYIYMIIKSKGLLPFLDVSQIFQLFFFLDLKAKIHLQRNPNLGKVNKKESEDDDENLLQKGQRIFHSSTCFLQLFLLKPMKLASFHCKELQKTQLSTIKTSPIAAETNKIR